MDNAHVLDLPLSVKNSYLDFEECTRPTRALRMIGYGACIPMRGSEGRAIVVGRIG
jgi:hypothetical protein